jgi:hypothetical protein
MKILLISTILIFTVLTSISFAQEKPVGSVVRTTYTSNNSQIFYTVHQFEDSLFDPRERFYCYESDIYDVCRSVANDIHRTRLKFAEGYPENILLKSCELRGITVRVKYTLLDDRGSKFTQKTSHITPCSGI